MASRPSAKAPLSVLETSKPAFEKAFDKLCRRREAGDESMEKTVRRILERVAEQGDAEVLALTRKFDGARLETLEVTRNEWDAACEAVDPADRAALGKAAMRVRDFHRRRIPSSWEMREEGGGYLGQRVRPLERVGLYVPGGKAVYPSSVIMNAIPASVVEVPEILMATPPGPDGSVRPEVLMAARIAGVHRVFKMGGAQAVAAFAYGTESVPRVDKIVGPGNVYVQAAKRLVFGEVSIDSEAGPTEVVVVADRSATPAWVAADLLSQAEHEEQASAVLVTHVKSIATRVQEQIAKQLKTFERAAIAKKSLASRGAVVLTRNLQESIDVANRFAPEHLVLALDGAENVLKQITNAGAVFLGHYTPVAVGDYIAGPNHVLPTGGTARFFSPLVVEDFLKRMSFVRFEPPKLPELGADVIRLAELEGLHGHGTSVELRLQKIRRARREREASREAELEAWSAMTDERRAEIERKTRETDIRLSLALDGSGQYDVATGIPFFDHMLESFAKHALFDLHLRAKGDLSVDLHHTVEDVGIALGQALRQALGEARGIRRYGQQLLPMAEAKVEVAVDVSNRPYLVYRVALANDRVGDFDVSLVEDFLYAFSQNAGLDLHVELRYGKSPHHVVEAIFKGLARSLRAALERDPRGGGVPSVKGAL